MKKIFSVVFLLVLVHSMFAQKENNKKLFRKQNPVVRSSPHSYLKSAPAYSLSLDSIVYYIKSSPSDSFVESKEVQLYADQGRKVTQLRYDLNSSKALVLMEKNLLRFDDEQNELYRLNADWDSELGEFINYYSDIYTYKTNLKTSYIRFDTWDNETKRWGYGYKDSSDFNLQNQNVRILGYSWDAEAQTFQPTVKDTFIYINTLLREKQSFEFDQTGKSWTKAASVIYKRLSNDSVYRIEYSYLQEPEAPLETTQIEKFYYGNDYLVDSTILFDTASISQSINPAYKKAYDYFPSNKLKTIRTYIWDQLENTWIIESRKSFGYDNHGWQNFDSYFYWYNSGQYIKDSTFTIFDNSGTIISEENFLKHTDNSSHRFLANYFYTPGMGYNSIYLPFAKEFAEAFFNNKRVDYCTTFDWDNDTLTEQGTVFFYYNPVIPDKTKELSGLIKTKIYPNPATSNIIIDGAGLTTFSFIKLYDINGKFISKWHINSNRTTISVNNLPSGMYILEMQSDKGIIREKIVKK